MCDFETQMTVRSNTAVGILGFVQYDFEKSVETGLIFSRLIQRIEVDFCYDTMAPLGYRHGVFRFNLLYPLSYIFTHIMIHENVYIDEDLAGNCQHLLRFHYHFQTAVHLQLQTCQNCIQSS